MFTLWKPWQKIAVPKQRPYEPKTTGVKIPWTFCSFFIHTNICVDITEAQTVTSKCFFSFFFFFHIQISLEYIAWQAAGCCSGCKVFNMFVIMRESIFRRNLLVRVLPVSYPIKQSIRFMACIAVHHQGAIEMFCFHFHREFVVIFYLSHVVYLYIHGLIT